MSVQSVFPAVQKVFKQDLPDVVIEDDFEDRKSSDILLGVVGDEARLFYLQKKLFVDSAERATKNFYQQKNRPKDVPSLNISGLFGNVVESDMVSNLCLGLFWEHIHDSFPHSREYSGFMAIRRGWEVVATKESFRVTPEMFYRGHAVLRFYERLKRIMVGQHLFDGNPFPSLEEGMRIGSITNDSIKQLFVLLNLMGTVYNREFSDSQSQHSVYSRFAAKTHMEYIHYMLSASQMRDQIDLLQQLASCGLIFEMPDLKSIQRLIPIEENHVVSIDCNWDIVIAPTEQTDKED